MSSYIAHYLAVLMEVIFTVILSQIVM